MLIIYHNDNCEIYTNQPHKIDFNVPDIGLFVQHILFFIILQNDKISDAKLTAQKCHLNYLQLFCMPQQPVEWCIDYVEVQSTGTCVYVCVCVCVCFLSYTQIFTHTHTHTHTHIISNHRVKPTCSYKNFVQRNSSGGSMPDATFRCGRINV